MNDEFFMGEAIAQAQLAAARDEVPVGAVVVLNGEIIGRGFNQPISSHDPTAHAEVVALRDAAKRIANYRLADAELFVTIEPCTMCSGALTHARIKRLVYGAAEPKAGVVHSQPGAFNAAYLNHKIEVTAGVLAQECSAVMQAFFARRREEKKALKNNRDE
ncbi:MAG: tRNA adenosine(34) deaminase TadA [Oceanospirillaceae bacterium]|nr:tRNA adenosine(34) deaminase TadA [Oceanospirillaceae bacterium]